MVDETILLVFLVASFGAHKGLIPLISYRHLHTETNYRTDPPKYSGGGGGGKPLHELSCEATKQPRLFHAPLRSGSLPAPASRNNNTMDTTAKTIGVARCLLICGPPCRKAVTPSLLAGLARGSQEARNCSHKYTNKKSVLNPLLL